MLVIFTQGQKNEVHGGNCTHKQMIRWPNLFIISPRENYKNRAGIS